MQLDGLFAVKSPVPIAVGAGLVALDVVIDGWQGPSPLVSAGGSCGNVMSILAYLGWKTFPVAHLGDDLAADLVLKDLAKFGVEVDFLLRDPDRHTPIVIERIPAVRSSRRTHSFSFECPICRTPLPRYRAVSRASAGEVLRRLSHPLVFYFDRPSRTAALMAEIYSARGTLVVFEPSGGVHNGRLFSECLSHSHVVKYSHQRLGHIADVTEDIPVPLELETLGSSGLRFRWGEAVGHRSPWHHVTAYGVAHLKDDAGCGDWCTAGIIHLLAQEGLKVIRETNMDYVLETIRFGQALAAMNCQFEGARGGMYSLNSSQLRRAVVRLLRGGRLVSAAHIGANQTHDDLLRSICPRCSGAGDASSTIRAGKGPRLLP